jgi:hypothetical protein
MCMWEGLKVIFVNVVFPYQSSLRDEPGRQDSSVGLAMDCRPKGRSFFPWQGQGICLSPQRAVIVLPSSLYF